MMEKAGTVIQLPEGTTLDNFFLEDGRYVSSWQPLKTYSPSVKWPEGWEVQLNPRRSSHASALDEWWRFVQVKTDSSAGVGDVNSNVRGSGARYNSGKPDFSLLPLSTLEDEVRVWMYGEKKYSRDNWKRGMAWSVPFASLLRHLTAWQRGEENDPESGLPHLAHAMCNLRMLTYYATEYPEGDDRLCAPK